MKKILGRILRVGVYTSASIILTGGIFFFVQHTGEKPDFSSFHSEPERLRHIHAIISQAFQLKSRAIIQFGILLLIATPVARVLFSLIAFLMEKDWIYILITFIVLVILLLSLFSNYLAF